MFGDSFGVSNQLWLHDGIYAPSYSFDPEYDSLIDLPAPGGGRHLKITENNKALPMDRVYFSYNHFDNARQSVGLDVPNRTIPIDRYTLGVEKTFFDGQWSAEVRLPFGGGYHLSATDFGTQNGDVGNVGIILKRLLYSTPYGAIGGGLGIDTPTAGDVIGRTRSSEFVFYNDAVHLSPWVGFLRAPDDCFFYQGFLQVDVPTNGNRVDFGGNRLGTVADQTLMLIDLEAGYWLYRDRSARCLTGLASILEFHYTTTMQDADLIGGTDGDQYLIFTNTDNRVDIANLTVGLHAEMGMTTLSVGGVFPLSTNSNRIFDAEVQVFLNRQF